MKKLSSIKKESIFRSEIIANINIFLFFIAFCIYNAAFFNLFDLNKSKSNFNLTRVRQNLTVLDSFKISFDNSENGILFL